MKLKFYRQSDLKGSPRGKATVRVNTKTGMISFNKSAAQHLNLEAPQNIMLAQDQERPEDFYISLFRMSTSEDSFILRQYKNQSFAFNNTALACLLQKNIPAAKGLHSFKMFIGPCFKMEDTEISLFPIITKSARP